MSNTMERVRKAQKEADKVLGRISKSRTKLVARLPFFGHLALKLRPRVTNGEYGINTAAVGADGSLIVNAAFAETLTDPELCFVVCHEVLHPAMLYFERMQGRIPKLWNIAHDYAINLIIKQMADANIKLISDCLCDDKYTDWSAEEIYDELLKDAVMVNIAQGCESCDGTGQQGGGDPGQSDSGQGDPGDGQGDGSGDCQGQGQGSGQGKPCPDCGGSGGGKGGKGNGGQNPLNDPLFGDGRNDIADTDDGKKAQQGDKGAANRINTDWKISIVEAAQRHERQKGRGTLPGSLQRLIEELTDPKVDWREKLARWVGENGRQMDYSYRRPSRRSESVGQYMPSLQAYGVDDIVLMIDTSGSIGDRMLKEGLAEVNGVCEDLGISCRAMIIDAALHDDCTIHDAYELAEKLSGGGGSDFRPAFDKLRDEQFEGVVIAFTDGDIAVPYDKPTGIKGVLWVLYEGCTAPTQVYGETVMIPKE
jgi:predicted metal-dependent peptidase